MNTRGDFLVRTTIATFFLCVIGAWFSEFAAGQSSGSETDPAPKSARRIAIVIHPDNPNTTLSKAEIGRLFLKKRRTWPDGEKCVPVDRSGSSEIREVFYRVLLGMEQDELKRHWMEQTMTGDARPPVSVDNAVVAKKYVEKLKGAVAYVWEDEVDDTVVVLHVSDADEFLAPKVSIEPPNEEADGS